MIHRFLLAVAAALVAVTACTSSASHQAPTSPAPSSAPMSAIAAPTTSADAASCPFLKTSSAFSTTGMRLARITVQRASGRTVGCRFYGLQHPNDQCSATCLSGEHLPGPTQPAIEISSTRYPSATAAMAAIVHAAAHASGLQRQQIGGRAGVCYATDFYAKDAGTDSLCTVAKGDVVLVVRTVNPVNSGGLGNAAHLADMVFGAY